MVFVGFIIACHDFLIALLFVISYYTAPDSDMRTGCV